MRKKKPAPRTRVATTDSAPRSNTVEIARQVYVALLVRGHGGPIPDLDIGDAAFDAHADPARLGLGA